MNTSPNCPDNNHFDPELNIVDDATISTTNLPTENNDALPLYSSLSVKKARDEVKAFILDYANNHIDYVLQMDKAKQHNQQQRKKHSQDTEALMTPPNKIAPAVVNSTVGIGKSYMIDEVTKLLCTENLPLVIVVQNHKLAKEYCERIPNAFEYFGRTQDFSEWKKPLAQHPGEKFICYKTEPVKQVNDKNHRPAHEFCPKCPHSAAWVLKNVEDDDKKYNIERRANAKNVLLEINLKLANVKPCHYLYEGLKEAHNARVLVMTAQAFSDSFAVFNYLNNLGERINNLPRLVIFDEKVKLSKEIPIKTPAVSQWIDLLIQLTTTLQSTIDRLSAYKKLSEEAREDLQDAEDLILLIPEIRAVFENFIESITKSSAQIQSEQIIALYQKVMAAGGFRGGTARWESVKFSQEGITIPLRALKTLALNLQGDTVRKADNCIYVYEITPGVEWAIEKGSTLFLDATASHTMRLLVESVNGSFFNKQVAQNMIVTRYTGFKYGKGRTESDNQAQENSRMEKEAKVFMRDLEAIAAQMPKDRSAAILTHKQILQYSSENHHSPTAAEDAAAAFHARTGVEVGWFNAHDRGQNNWCGKNLAIVGMEWIPTSVIAQEYAEDQAALQRVGVFLPKWDGKLSEADYLPTQPEVRAWFLDRCAGNIAQGIGRARAINETEKPLLIQLWGGIQSAEMDAALLKKGVVVNAHEPNTIHRTRKDWYNRGSDNDKIDQAAQMLKTVQHKASVRSIKEKLRVIGGKAGTDSISKRLKELIALGIIPPAQSGRPKNLGS